MGPAMRTILIVAASWFVGSILFTILIGGGYYIAPDGSSFPIAGPISLLCGIGLAWWDSRVRGRPTSQTYADEDEIDLVLARYNDVVDWAYFDEDPLLALVEAVEDRAALESQGLAVVASRQYATARGWEILVTWAPSDALSELVRAGLVQVPGGWERIRQQAAQAIATYPDPSTRRNVA